MPPSPDNPDFSVRVHQTPDGEATIVSVDGDVDITTAGELERVVVAEMLRAPVLLDLRGVAFMDSSGLRVLDALVRHHRAGGGELRIDPTLSDSVVQVLELTGMMQILPLAVDGPRR